MATSTVTASPDAPPTATVSPTTVRPHGVFTITGLMTFAGGGVPSLMSDGRVLILGLDYDKAEVYDPGTGTFISTPLPMLPTFNSYKPLVDGRVLLLDTEGRPYVYDPASGMLSTAGSMKIARLYFGAAELANHDVLILGGTDTANTQYITAAEIYDPATGKTSTTGSMAEGCESFSATLLKNGDMMIAGGERQQDSGDDVFLSSAEIYNPVPGSSPVPAPCTRLEVSSMPPCSRTGGC